MGEFAIIDFVDVSDPYLEKLVLAAVSQLRARRVLLFGSRARGDAGLRADYDIAVEAPGAGREQWVRFVTEMEEGLDTLLPVDLVWMAVRSCVSALSKKA